MKRQSIFNKLLLLFVVITVGVLAPAEITTAKATDVSQSNKLIAPENLAPQSYTKSAQTKVWPQSSIFDGYKLYAVVFEHLRTHSLALTDRTKMEQWASEWKNKHTDDGLLDTQEGADKAIQEMIDSLGQRFDSYNLPEANRREMELFNSTMVGIGIPVVVEGLADEAKKITGGQASKISLTISDEHPLVIQDEPFEGSPAAQAGILAGDRILAIDGHSVDGKTLSEAVNEIRGPAGSTVELTLERDDLIGTMEITVKIVRKRLVTKPVKTKDLGGGVTYIRLRDFVSRFAEKDMAEALNHAANGKAIVLDLRGNPGGRMEAVQVIGQYFLEKGTLMVVKSRMNNSRNEIHTVLEPDRAFKKTENGDFGFSWWSNIRRQPLIVPPSMPIVVIVDNNSASAAEILAGMLQVNDRAVIVGKTTLGKGVGQTVIPLPFDRNIHVTSFEFLPGGLAMDGIGIIPDIEVESPPNRFAANNDPQLEAARQVASDAIKKAEELQDKNILDECPEGK